MIAKPLSCNTRLIPCSEGEEEERGRGEEEGGGEEREAGVETTSQGGEGEGVAGSQGGRGEGGGG